MAPAALNLTSTRVQAKKQKVEAAAGVNSSQKVQVKVNVNKSENRANRVIKMSKANMSQAATRRSKAGMQNKTPIFAPKDITRNASTQNSQSHLDAKPSKSLIKFDYKAAEEEGVEDQGKDLPKLSQINNNPHFLAMAD